SGKLHEGQPHDHALLHFGRHFPALYWLIRVFRPAMFRIAPAQLATKLRIEAPPKSGEIASHLHRPLIWRQEMQYHWNVAPRDTRLLFQSEKILQARRSPGWLVRIVMDLEAASRRQLKRGRRNFIERASRSWRELLFEGAPQAAGAGGC